MSFYASEMQSVVKQNLHVDTEGDLNKLVNLKLTASYTYLALGMYFDRDDVALPKFSSFFLEQSIKERDQAEKLLEYQNKRGGRVLLQAITKPTREDWRVGHDAMLFSLDYQKSLNTCILDVHRRAGTNGDPHLCDFLEEQFLDDSHKTMKKLGDYVGSLGRIATDETTGLMGEYLFDKHSL